MRRTISLIILLLAIDAISAQTLCNNRNLVFIPVDYRLEANLTDKELEINLNTLIDPSLLEGYKADYLFITFIVNCKGEDFEYKLSKLQDGKFLKDSLSNFQEVLLSKMQLWLTWTPMTMKTIEKGKMIEKAEDCQGSYIIRIDRNKFHILNEKEKRKFFQKKPKK